MLTLEQLARQVVEHWESSDLQVHVRALARHLQELDADRADYARHIVQARALTVSDDIAFDDQPIVSPGAHHGGVFINAWLWIGTLDLPAC